METWRYNWDHIPEDPNLVVDYTVSDDQLVAFGISPRIIALSRQPFMRPYNGNTFEMPSLDLQYVESICQAQDTVSLAALAINNPHVKNIHFPIGCPYMGFCRC